MSLLVAASLLVAGSVFPAGSVSAAASPLLSTPPRSTSYFAASPEVGAPALLPSASAVAARTSGPGPGFVPARTLVLIGVSGLSWSAVDAVRTPALAGLADAHSDAVAVGSVSVRSAQTPTCPVDGWLTLSAGVRAAGPARSGGRCPRFPALLPGPAPQPSTTSSTTRRAGGPEAAGAPRGPAVAAPAGAVAVHVADWAALRSSNVAGPYRGAPGTLGAALTGDGGCVSAVGPGAALAAARVDGTVDRWSPLSALGAGVLDECRVTVVDAGDGAAAAERAWRTVARAAPPGTTVLLAGVADGPVGARPTPQLGLLALRDPPASALEPVPAGGRAAGRPVVTGTGGSVTSASTDWPGVVTLTDLTATLLAAGTTTEAVPAVRSPVRPVRGNAAPAGAVPVAGVAVAGVAAGAGGAVLTRTAGHPGLAGLRATALRARVAAAAVPVWLTVSGVGVLGLIGGQLLLRRRSRTSTGHRPRSRTLQLLALTVLALPVATRLANLVPWWAAGGTGLRGPAAALWATQLGWAVLLAGAAAVVGTLVDRTGPRAAPKPTSTPALARATSTSTSTPTSTRTTTPTSRSRPIALTPSRAAGSAAAVSPADARRRRGVAGPTAAVLALLVASALVTVVDLVAGAPLSHLAVIGLLPIDGSRFHGLGNEIVAATDAAVLLAASAAAGPLLGRGRTRWAVAVVVAAGSLFAVLDGSPALGDDFGGVPATVAGTAVTALAVAGVRLRVRRAVAVAVLAVASGLVGGLLDATRPAGRRTHLGTFVVAALHGGGGAVIGRKALAVLGPFAGSAGAWAGVGVWGGVAVTAVLAAVVLRPGSDVLPELAERWPAWRAGIAGAGAAGAVGAVLNDSGAVVLLVVCGATVAAITAVSAAPGPTS